MTGRIIDASSGRPVDQALLTLSPGNRRTLSDSTGAFVFLDIFAGDFQLEIQHIGFATRTIGLTVEPRLNTYVDVSLASDPIELEALNVQIEHRIDYLDGRGFYARKAHGVGTFFDPAWIRRWSSGQTRAADVVQTALNFSPLFSAFRDSEGCGVSIFVDGVPYRPDPTTRLGPEIYTGPEPTSLLLDISPTELGAVEVYATGQGTPGWALSPPGCPVILIWRKRWTEYRPVAEREIDLCVPRFEEGEITVEGVVRDEFTGVPLPGASVEVVYREPEDRALETLVVTADHEGWFRACDLPGDASITLTARVLGNSGIGTVLENADRPVVLRDLAIEISGPGRVVGRILDRETGQPVSTATVSIAGLGTVTRTDGQGYFLLEEVVPGEQMMEVSHLAYEPLAETISVVADGTVDVRAELSADPFELEPIVITAVRDRRLDTRGFYDRKIWGERIGNGAFFEREQIEQRNPIYISHLVRDLPGIRLDCSTRGCKIGTIRSGGCTEMAVWLDGVQVIRPLERRVDDTITIDELVRPVEVAAVEVYPGASSLPAEYSGPTGMCGAVVIWTK